MVHCIGGAKAVGRGSWATGVGPLVAIGAAAAELARSSPRVIMTAALGRRGRAQQCRVVPPVMRSGYDLLVLPRGRNDPVLQQCAEALLAAARALHEP